MIKYSCGYYLLFSASSREFSGSKIVAKLWLRAHTSVLTGSVGSYDLNGRTVEIIKAVLLCKRSVA